MTTLYRSIVGRFYPFNWLRRRVLIARLSRLQWNANILQAQMLADPLRLAQYRIAITETTRELERLEATR